MASIQYGGGGMDGVRDSWNEVKSAVDAAVSGGNVHFTLFVVFTNPVLNNFTATAKHVEAMNNLEKIYAYEMIEARMQAVRGEVFNFKPLGPGSASQPADDGR